MSDNEHSHDEHDHSHPANEVRGDASSQALSEALRSSFTIVKIAMIALLLLFLASGFFQVGPQEKAVILRFGKPVGEGEKMLLGAGLHWSWPYPIDDVVKIPITEIQTAKSSIGWIAEAPGQELLSQDLPPRQTLNPAIDGYLVTGDGNIIHAKATLRYRISDPIRYVFNFTSASNLVQNALDNALLSTAAHYRVDDILSRDVTGFREAVRRSATELLDAAKVGVTVETCDVDPRPPGLLKADFDNVTKAEVTRNELIYAARTYENKTTNQAAADAISIINLAETERRIMVESLAADADRFNKLLPQFQSNADLFIRQNLAETMGKFLGNAREIFIQPTASDGTHVENRIMLNRAIQKPK